MNVYLGLRYKDSSHEPKKGRRSGLRGRRPESTLRSRKSHLWSLNQCVLRGLQEEEGTRFLTCNALVCWESLPRVSSVHLPGAPLALISCA